MDRTSESSREKSQREAGERFRQTLELMDLGFAVMRENLQRRFPKASEAEIDQKFSDWLASRPPMSGKDLRDVTDRRATRSKRLPGTLSRAIRSSNRGSKRAS